MNLDKLNNLKPTPKIQALLNKRMWMRFILTGIMFGSFYWVVWLLFTDSYTLDDKFRDLLNIIIGSFLVSFGKVVDFWFKGSHSYGFQRFRTYGV